MSEDKTEVKTDDNNADSVMMTKKDKSLGAAVIKLTIR